MQYTLIMKNGKVMSFYIKSVAELYQNLYGGTLCNFSATELLQEYKVECDIN